MCCEAKIL